MPEYTVRIKVELEILVEGKDEPDAEQNAWTAVQDAGDVVEGTVVSVTGV